MIRVKRSKGKGRGVFATRDIKRGEIIEVSPVIIIPDDEVQFEHLLSLYVFSWGRDSLCLALGYGSLINHSRKRNVSYIMKGKKIIFRAAKGIKAGSELFIDYGYNPVIAYQNYKRAKNASR